MQRLLKNSKLNLVLPLYKIIYKVESLREGTGKPIPPKIADRYRAMWIVDPEYANGTLVYFELAYNEIPFNKVPHDIANEIDLLMGLRFNSLDEWGLGPYGYSPPDGERKEEML